ncbi:MAG: hypothetical protein JWM55_1284 [Acidimicrobiaceae bacterium]|nr:hypothetical protein [Acidimicrobiaceae bacterium]
MPSLQRTSFYLSALVLTGASVIALSSLAASATTKATAKTVLKATSTELAKQTSVHIKVRAVAASTASSVVADIGEKAGTETFTKGAESFSITVTPTFAYLSGSATGLTTIMGLTSAEQKKVGKSAISMRKGSAPYNTFKTNLTVGALVNLLPVAKGTTLLAKRDKVTNGYVLKWVTAASGQAPKSTTVLTISSGRKSLPTKELVTTSAGTTETTFSKWGHGVRVVVPSSTIPYSTIFPAKS